MAATIKPCSACGVGVSTQAGKCPHCGQPNPAMTAGQAFKTNFWKGVMLGIVAGVITDDINDHDQQGT